MASNSSTMSRLAWTATAALVGFTTLAAQELKPETLYANVVPSVATIRVEKGDGSVGVATAFLALQDGIAITAWHVVNDATRAVVKFSDGEEFEASGLIDKDAARDVALVRVKVAGRPLLHLLTNDIVVGSKAYVVGSPQGLEFTISDGLVSQIQTVSGSKQIQFSCPASPGNSGGPLLNGNGDVIGVVSWQVVNGQNLNFAAPSAYAAGLDATLPTTRWQDVPHSTAPGQALSVAPTAARPKVGQNPRDVLASAKTMFVQQTAGNPELMVAVERELQSWSRFSLVSDAAQADMILQLAPTADVNLWFGKGAKAVATLTSNDGLRLWTTVKGGDWSMAGYSFPKVGKAIVEELRKFVGTAAKK